MTKTLVEVDLRTTATEDTSNPLTTKIEIIAHYALPADMVMLFTGTIKELSDLLIKVNELKDIAKKLDLALELASIFNTLKG